MLPFQKPIQKLMRQAQEKKEAKQYQEAIADYTEVLKLDPNRVDAYFGRAWVLDETKKYQEAIADLDDVVKRDAKHVGAYHNRGIAKHTLGKFLDCIADCNQALNLNSEHTITYHLRAQAFSALDENDKALLDLEEALKHNPNYIPAYSFRATINNKLNKYSQAIADAEKVLKLDAKHANAYIHRGIAHVGLKNFEQALLDLEKGINIHRSVDMTDESIVNTRVLLVTVKNNLKKYTEALVDLNDIFRHSKPQTTLDATLYETRAQIIDALFKEGKSPEIALHQAIQTGNILAVNQLLEHKDFKERIPHTLTQQVYEPALLTVAFLGKKALLKLVVAKCPVTITDSYGNSALHRAAQSGHVDIIDELMSHRAITEKEYKTGQWPKNREKWAPWHTAACYGQVETIIHLQDKYLSRRSEGFQLLLSPIQQQNTILHLLIEHRDTIALEKLLTRYSLMPLNLQNSQGLTPFLLAVTKKDLAAVKVLAKYHLDTTDRDNEGSSALHLAVKSGELAMVQYLVTTLQLSLDVRDNSNKLPSAYCSSTSEIGVFLYNQQRKNDGQVMPAIQTQGNPRYLVAQGGSVKAIAHVACLERLQEEKGFLDNLIGVGGTSAGAIIALLVGLGYTINQIKHMMGIVSHPDCAHLPIISFRSFLDGDEGKAILAAKQGKLGDMLFSRCAKIFEVWSKEGILGTAGTVDTFFADGYKFLQKIKLFQEKQGICPGKELRDLFEKLIRIKIKETLKHEIENATFKQLADLGFKKIYFIGVNTRTAEAETFSVDHTPDAVVADALRISISIPGIFYFHPKVTKNKNATGEYDEKSLTSSDDLYIDGGVLRNGPYDLFDFYEYAERPSLKGLPTINNAVLAMRLVAPASSKEIKNSRIKTILEDLYKYTTPSAQDRHHSLPSNAYRTIEISTRDIGMMDFDRVEEASVKQLLLEEGRKGAEHFLKRAKYTEIFFRLPEELRRFMMTHLETEQFILKPDGGIDITSARVRRNCPELVAKFYGEYTGGAVEFLHDQLKLSAWERDAHGNTAFHFSATFEDPTALNRLLTAFPAGALATNQIQETPLEWAYRHKKDKAVSLLNATKNKLRGGNTISSMLHPMLWSEPPKISAETPKMPPEPQPSLQSTTLRSKL